MGWHDIPKWKNMSKEELLAELTSEHSPEDKEAFKDRYYFIYVNNCYELAGSIDQKWPKDYHLMLWSHKHGLSDKGKWGF